LLHRYERWNDESILTQLVTEGFLGLVLGTELLKFTHWLLLLKTGKVIGILTRKMSLFEVVLHISVEFPDQDTVTLTATDDL
jgi:hypothetical protein